MPKASKENVLEWRRGSVFTRLERPTNIGKARALGYKAKPGFVIVRIKIGRGGRTRTRPRSARKTAKQTIRKTLMMNYRWVAEQRVGRRFRPLEVLNSYLLGKDGINSFYEIILVDPNSPQIRSDPQINWICRPENRGRVFRGLTGAARKSTG